MANPNVSEIISTTIENRQKEMADNTSNNNAFLRRCKEKGNNTLWSGGYQINQPLDYDENSTAGPFSGFETLDVSAQDVLTSATYDIKEYYVSVVMSGLEMAQNSGPEQIIDLLEARIKNAERSLANVMSNGVYSDGTGSSNKQITGLQAQVADAGTGTVGNINSSTYTFWQNVTYDATTDGGAAATSSNIQKYMTTVWAQLVRGKDQPDLILADDNYWTLYANSLQANQRIMSQDGSGTAGTGFVSLKFMNADVVLDGGVGGDSPTNHMYFLNTDYLFFKTHKDFNFVKLGPDRFPTNQHAVAQLIGWKGNMTCSNRSLQGVLKD